MSLVVGMHGPGDVHVLLVGMPPLRQRTEDIARLVDHFITRFAAEEGRKVQWREAVGRPGASELRIENLPFCAASTGSPSPIRTSACEAAVEDDRVLFDDTISMAAARGLPLDQLPSLEPGGTYNLPLSAVVASQILKNLRYPRGCGRKMSSNYLGDGSAIL